MRNSLLLIIFIFITNLNAQSGISFSALGGFNYVPVDNFSHYVSTLPNSETDKLCFSGDLKLRYYYDIHGSIFISSEYISTNASWSGFYVTEIWTISIIPITVGYEYNFNVDKNDLKPYVGLGISYILTSTETKYLGDDGSNTLNYYKNTFGFEAKIGVEKNMIDNLYLNAELKYRYINDTKLNIYNDVLETNLSGMGLLVGIMLKIK